MAAAQYNPATTDMYVKPGKQHKNLFSEDYDENLFSKEYTKNLLSKEDNENLLRRGVKHEIEGEPSS